MNKTSYFLIALAEECAELQKEITKALRFGLNSTHPLGGDINKHRIYDEFLDIIATMQVLINNTEFEAKENLQMMFKVLQTDEQDSQKLTQKMRKLIKYEQQRINKNGD